MLILGLPQKDIARDLPHYSAHEMAVPVEEHHRPSVLRAPAHQERADHDIACRYNTSEMMKRHLQLDLAFHFDLNRLMIEGEIGALGHNIKGVKELFHVASILYRTIYRYSCYI